MKSGIHGNTVKARIRRINRDIVTEAMTVETYQKELCSLLAQIPDMFVRIHYENMALLPLETRH